MTITPATRTAVIAAINALETATLLPTVVRRDALTGACILTGGAGIVGLTLGQIEAELDHIIVPTMVQAGPYVVRGYTKTALLAAIA